jgi:hypothetical protein
MLPAMASTGTMNGEAADEHARRASAVVVEVVVHADAAKALPLFPAAEEKA